MPKTYKQIVSDAKNKLETDLKNHYSFNKKKHQEEETPQCDVCSKELYKEGENWVCEDDDLHNDEEEGVFHCSNCQAEMEQVENMIDGRWEVTELVCENCGTREEL